MLTIIRANPYHPPLGNTGDQLCYLHCKHLFHKQGAAKSQVCQEMMVAYPHSSELCIMLNIIPWFAACRSLGIGKGMTGWMGRRVGVKYFGSVPTLALLEG
jgi:hypothetical protein